MKNKKFPWNKIGKVGIFSKKKEKKIGKSHAKIGKVRIFAGRKNKVFSNKKKEKNSIFSSNEIRGQRKTKTKVWSC